MNRFNPSINLINYASVITLVTFLIVIAMTALFLWPKFQELRIIQKDIEEKKAELQTKEEYFSMLSELKNKLGERQDELSKINSVLPGNPSLPSFFNYLQKTSSQSGLILETVSSFAISPSQSFPDLQETLFSIGVAGSYSSLKNFLATLEKSARLIEIENISFSLAQEKKDLFTFNLTLKIYSY